MGHRPSNLHDQHPAADRRDPAPHKPPSVAGGVDGAHDDTPLFRAMLGEAWYRNGDGALRSDRPRRALVLSPSTVMDPPPLTDLREDYPYTRLDREPEPPGLPRVLVGWLGSTLGILAGSLLTATLLAPAIFLGVLLLLAGLAGVYVSLTGLRGWVPPATEHLGVWWGRSIRALGYIAAGVLLVALVASLVPRSAWPI